jgi:hypothetical protein
MSPAFMAGLGGAGLIAMYNYRPLQYLLRVCHIGLHVALCGLEVLAVGRRSWCGSAGARASISSGHHNCEPFYPLESAVTAHGGRADRKGSRGYPEVVLIVR